MMNTLFEVRNPLGDEPSFITEVRGVGQESASAILKEYPFHVVILSGFIDETTRIPTWLNWN